MATQARQIMQQKLYNNLLLFSLCGVAMWFFGNLYEGVVIAPNLLSDSVQKAHYWQSFFVVTNPVFFYIPLAPLATITLFILYFRTPKQVTELKRHLKFASIFQILSLALSIYIITQINLQLFFRDLNKSIDEIHSKAVLWNFLNGIRVILVAISLTYLFKAYIQLKSTKYKSDEQ